VRKYRLIAVIVWALACLACFLAGAMVGCTTTKELFSGPSQTEEEIRYELEKLIDERDCGKLGCERK